MWLKMKLNNDFFHNSFVPIFLKIFPGSKNISMNTTAKDIESWDSLNNIRLLVALEKELSIKYNISAKCICKCGTIG